jgi:hypothetical protein
MFSLLFHEARVEPIGFARKVFTPVVVVVVLFRGVLAMEH